MNNTTAKDNNMNDTHTSDNYDQGDTCHECCTEVPNGTRLCSECAWVWDLARPWN